MKKALISMLIIAFSWHFSSYFNIVDPFFFPSPFKIFKNTYLLVINDGLLIQVYHSMKRLFLAASVATPLGIGLAILMTHSKVMDDYINPLIAFSFPLPKVAIYPLLLLIAGIGDLSKVFLIGLGMFYLIFINTRMGLKRLMNGQAVEIVKIYKIRRVDYIYEFLLKGAQLEILTGLKLALNYGLTLVVVSEFSTSNNGIGYYIWRSWDQFKIINVYSGILILSVIGCGLYFGFNALIERAKEKFF